MLERFAELSQGIQGSSIPQRACKDKNNSIGEGGLNFHHPLWKDHLPSKKALLPLLEGHLFLLFQGLAISRVVALRQDSSQSQPANIGSYGRRLVNCNPVCYFSFSTWMLLFLGCRLHLLLQANSKVGSRALSCPPIFIGSWAQRPKISISQEFPQSGIWDYNNPLYN